jgi:hypothetical protein
MLHLDLRCSQVVHGKLAQNGCTLLRRLACPLLCILCMRPTLLFCVLVGLVLLVASPVRAQADAATDDCPDAACPFDLDEPIDPPVPAPQPVAKQVTLDFFWGVGCPHCEEAKPFVDDLQRGDHDLRIQRWEVRKDPEGRKHFIETMKRLGAKAVGIPTFVVGERYLVGFQKGSTEREVRRMIEAERKGQSVEAPKLVQLPVVGLVDVRAMSLPAFTVLVGLVDGINPCAMWVLLVLLGILMHVKSRRRLLLFGGTFVVMSGVVYFAFMTAWSLFFQLAGLSRAITIGLGLVVLAMGLVNLKELIWFKRGVSLMVPERAKPGLFRRMRGIATAASLPTAFLGVFVLAFVVNLIELGCTLGLPAVYTRVLSLHELSSSARYAYLALYNLMYVVPLALIVLVYALSMHRLVLSERGAKVLKGISGAVLVASGLIFVLQPELLY